MPQATVIDISHLEKRFPHIVPKEGEDLNIERNLTALVKKFWDNPRDYPTVPLICRVLGLSERTVYRYAENNNWPDRGTVKSELYS